MGLMNHSQHTQSGPLHTLLRIAQMGIVSGSLFVAAGCNDEPESHRVSAPPPGAASTSQPVIVTAPGTSATAVGGNTVIVTQAPPAPQAENPGAQPERDDVWVPGYWTWRDGQYQWVAGHWQVPPEGSEIWNPPYWEAEGSGYRYYEGYWK
jgi:hypothetical protein